MNRPSRVGAIAAVTAELVKLRRSGAMVLIGTAPVIACILLVVSMQHVAVPVRPPDAAAVWRELLTKGGWVPWSGFFVPIIACLESSWLMNIEHRAHGWKNLFTTPVPRWSVYGSKFALCICLIGLSFAEAAAGLVLTLLVVIKVRGWDLPTGGIWTFTANTAARSFVAAWPVIAIQSWLSAKFSGIIVPAGVCFAALLAGFLVLLPNGEELLSLYPWTMPLSAVYVPSAAMHSVMLPALGGVVGGVFVSVLACWTLSRGKFRL